MAEIFKIEQITDDLSGRGIIATDDLSGYGIIEALPHELDQMPIEPMNTNDMILTHIIDLAFKTDAQNITDWLNALVQNFPIGSLVPVTGWIQVSAEYTFGRFIIRFDNRDGWHAVDENDNKYYPLKAVAR